eukprot:767594-Hanusia_phi.AAC.9
MRTCRVSITRENAALQRRNTAEALSLGRWPTAMSRCHVSMPLIGCSSSTCIANLAGPGNWRVKVSELTGAALIGE